MLLQSLVMLGSRGYMAIAKIAASVVVVHAFGAEGQGMYAVALNVSVIAALAGGAGLEVANAYDSGRHPELGRTLIVQSIAMAGGAGLGIGFVLWLAFPILSLFDGFHPGFGLLIAASPTLAILTNLLAGIAMGASRFVLIATANVLLYSVLLGSAAAGLALDAVTVPFAGWLVGNFMATTVLAVGLWRGLPGRLRVRGSGLAARLRFSYRVYFANLVNWLNMRLDLFVVASLLGTAAAGAYAVAATLAEGLLYLGKSVAQPLMARAIQRGAEWDHSALRPYRLVIGGTAAGAVLLALLAPVIIDGIYGPEVREATIPLVLLATAMPAAAFVTLASSHLFGLGLARPTALAAAVSAGLALVLDLLLVPRLGISAAAGASLIAYLTGAAILSGHLRPQLLGLTTLGDLLLANSEDLHFLWRHLRATLRRTAAS